MLHTLSVLFQVVQGRQEHVLQERDITGRTGRITVLEQAFAVRSRECHHAPQPSDHVLAQLKAGETVYQTGELPEILRVSEIHYEPPQDTFCIDFPAFN